MSISKKTYADSYVYRKFPEYEKNLLEFVMTGERIDKRSERFEGIVIDVKRRQVTSVISRVLESDQVILCIGARKELPAAFKVFTAKDVKMDQKPKVFIDVTNLVVLKDGFYTCPKIDILCTYLLAAMNMLVYEKEPEKLLSSSVLNSTSMSCFVSMVLYILDYLRINGFAENRNKIAYVTAMYYQIHMLGKERDQTAKNNAVRVANGAIRDISTYEFFYDLEDLQSIDTFIKSISDTFKLQGLTTDVFLEKWLWLIGKGTQFGTELYTAFSKILTDAFSGTYLNNQKNIEKCCGRNMVEYTNTLLRICSDCIDRGMYYESNMDREMLWNTRILKEKGRAMIYGNTTVVQEGLFGDKEVKAAYKEVDKAIISKKGSKIISTTKAYMKAMENLSESKRSAKCAQLVNIINLNNDVNAENPIDDPKILSNVCKVIKPYLLEKDKEKLRNLFNRMEVNIPKLLANKDPRIEGHEKQCKDALADAKAAHAVLK